jgi:hypothetical protein
MTTILLILKSIGSLLAKIPTIVWVAVISLAIGIICTNYYRDVKQTERDNAMIANADTTQVPHTITLPQPNPPPAIQGIIIPSAISRELAELRKSNLEKDTKIVRYDSMLVEREKPYSMDYEDDVQKLSVVTYPVDKTFSPLIDYKPQTIQVPQITQTLPTPKLPFYKTPTARVIYGAIGVACIYKSQNCPRSDRIYWQIGGVSSITIGIAL